MSELPGEAPIKDAKTALQELSQAQKVPLPVYELIEVDGPPHQRLFTVACLTELAQQQTTGEGSSRRAAEQRAATAMLELLEL